MLCPLCQTDQVRFFQEDRLRPYYRCTVCRLVFVPENHHLSPELEKSRYLLHQNHSEDRPYRLFLESFLQPLLTRIPAGSSGLDFGSGPNPVMASLLNKRGFPMQTYDPFFSPQMPAEDAHFDFITCVETVEHFRRPEKEWRIMVNHLKPGGWLGVKTDLLHPETEFSSWHYKGDPTHVCFYSMQTLEWIAHCFHLQVEFAGKAGTFFRKNKAGQV